MKNKNKNLLSNIADIARKKETPWRTKPKVGT
jgi:hypothetical protein